MFFVKVRCRRRSKKSRPPCMIQAVGLNASIVDLPVDEYRLEWSIREGKEAWVAE